MSDSSYGVIAPKVVATPSYEEPEIAPDTGLGSTYAGVLLLAAVLAAAVYGSKK